MWLLVSIKSLMLYTYFSFFCLVFINCGELTVLTLLRITVIDDFFNLIMSRLIAIPGDFIRITIALLLPVMRYWKKLPLCSIWFQTVIHIIRTCDLNVALIVVLSYDSTLFYISSSITHIIIAGKLHRQHTQ